MGEFLESLFDVLKSFYYTILVIAPFCLAGAAIYFFFNGHPIIGVAFIVLDVLYLAWFSK